MLQLSGLYSVMLLSVLAGPRFDDSICRSYLNKLNSCALEFSSTSIEIIKHCNLTESQRRDLKDLTTQLIKIIDVDKFDLDTCVDVIKAYRSCFSALNSGLILLNACKNKR